MDRQGCAPRCRRSELVALWLIVVTLGMVAGAALPGCGAPARQALTDAQLQERSELEAKAMVDTFAQMITKLLRRIERDESDSAGSTATIHLLAMSGGGDYGAFGAGVLVGWGTVADPDWRRPDFDIVTGVSTGALLAPFAYVGTDEACLTVESFYRNPRKDWVRESGLLFFLPFRQSFMTIPGLERDVRGVIDASFVAQMAEQSRAGKGLIVSATDLDLGRQRFWELGAESEAAVASGDIDRVQRVLLASAAIPAVFPPVQIDDGLYVDGGVTANVFLRLDHRHPHSLLARWRSAHPNKALPPVRYWIIVNNQDMHIPKTVQRRWPAVVAPSLATSIRSATLAEVRWLAAQADYVNAVYATDVEVRVLTIPDDWRPPVTGTFKKETMESLADLGRLLGADPAAWAVWAAPDRGRTSTP